MKKHLPIIASFLMLLATNIVAAQDAAKLVNTLSQSIRNHKNLVVDFTCQPAGAPTTEAKEGKAYLQNEAYKIVMDDQETISDGKVIWSYLKDEEEAIVSNATEGKDDTPVQLLTKLDKDFTAKLKGNDGKGNTLVELSNPKGEYETITLIIDKKGNLKGFEVGVDQDNKMIFNIKEMQFDQELKEGFFTFDTKSHPNVDIIDMR